MSETTHWTGLASGARTGTMTVEITRDGTQMTGTLRLLEPGVGELHSKFVGQWTTHNKLSARTLEHFMSNSGGAVTLPQAGKMEATFDARANVITGRWMTEIDPLGDFRWIQTAGSQPMSRDISIAAPIQFVRYWGRFTANAKNFFGKSRIRRDKRFTKWLIFALQLSLAGIVGYLVIDLVVNVFTGN
jgi:hypothetical protein